MFFSHGAAGDWFYFYISKIRIAMGVKIDFEGGYELDSVSKDLRTATFQTLLKDGKLVPLKVKISDEPHELLFNVYNLAFGPVNGRGQIDDKAELQHSDYSRTFSTILVRALRYLTKHPEHYIGIDGSDNSRAFYYWRLLQSNFDYLDKYFDMFGLKYYVRITRYGKYQYENPFDFDDIQPGLDKIAKTNKLPKQMYNYFVFQNKKSV